jgi:two-component sensor histidine kinase
MSSASAVEQFDQPALIIHTALAEIQTANSKAKRLWGLAEQTALPVAIDPEMPALLQLRSGPNGEPGKPLVFWTRQGAQSLRCSSRPLPEAELMLLIFEEPATSTPADASTPEILLPTTPAVPAELPTWKHASGIDLQSMAHELRTPIGAIMALAEMIEREQFGPLGDPRYREYARDIHDSARLSLNIVAAALEKDSRHSDVLPGGFCEINLPTIVDKCLRTVEQAAKEAGVAMHKNIGDNLPNLIANAPGLTQVLLNLMSNAIKFTPPGGSVCVMARSGEDGSLRIAVEDTGVGMTKRDASVLVTNIGSDLPNTASPPPRGIGFSLVRRLVAWMDGKFDLTSSRGHGTCVTLTFPASKVIPIGQAPSREHGQAGN